MLFIFSIVMHDGSMDLQQMRYVIAVAETRNFTRAAERCFVVQSALSHRVAGLERELGVRLFARTSRRVELTPAGEAFLPAARQSLDAADRAAAEAAAAVGVVRGRLAVGMIPTVAALDIPAVLESFREDHPEVRVALRVGASNEMAAQVAAGGLDIAVLGLPEDDEPRGVRFRVLSRDRHVAVVPGNHPLAGKARVSMRRLAEEVYVDFPVDSPGRMQSDRAFAAAQLARDVAFEVSELDLMVRIVRQGLAVALLPSAVAAGASGVVTVPITDGPRRVEYLAWSDFNPTPATTAFLRVLEPDGAAPSEPAVRSP